MTTARAYRAGRPAAEALAVLWRHAGSQFDMQAVQALSATLPAILRDMTAAGDERGPGGSGALHAPRGGRMRMTAPCDRLHRGSARRRSRVRAGRRESIARLALDTEVSVRHDRDAGRQAADRSS